MDSDSSEKKKKKDSKSKKDSGSDGEGKSSSKESRSKRREKSDGNESDSLKKDSKSKSKSKGEGSSSKDSTKSKEKEKGSISEKPSSRSKSAEKKQKSDSEKQSDSENEIQPSAKGSKSKKDSSKPPRVAFVPSTDDGLEGDKRPSNDQKSDRRSNDFPSPQGYDFPSKPNSPTVGRFGFQAPNTPTRSGFDHASPLSSSNRWTVSQDTPDCESCQREKVSSYCLNCDLMLCKSCDSGGHAIPAFSLHQRTPYSPDQVSRRFCPQHPREVLRYYCDTCDTPICNQCRLVGDHQGSIHLAIELPEAYRMKHATLRSYISSALNPKKERLMNAVAKMEKLIHDVRKKKSGTQAQLVSEIEGIMSHLESVEMRYTSSLMRESEAVKVELQQLQQFMAQTLDIEPFALFDRYSEIISTCDQISRKPIRAIPEIDATEYEHQFSTSYVTPEIYEKMTEEKEVREQDVNKHCPITNTMLHFHMENQSAPRHPL
eukprot:TRINITY_DN9331_c0_g1_i6.p1 TRINITY_DN9331_c0_g1~~TRINITY_DN9331_c0_g1_i6.p1  ORF type:complete len:487 (+),score=115.98 TRINITY_DN9331_c0_g1_i6:75-1535(+)